MSSLLLICAAFASLAFGVLMAYGICQILFSLFRVHALSAARRIQTASLRANARS